MQMILGSCDSTYSITMRVRDGRKKIQTKMQRNGLSQKSKPRVKLQVKIYRKDEGRITSTIPISIVLKSFHSIPPSSTDRRD